MMYFFTLSLKYSTNLFGEAFRNVLLHDILLPLLSRLIDVLAFLSIREYGSTLYVGLARAVSPTNTNFRLTFLLTRLQEALYEDLAV